MTQSKILVKPYPWMVRVENGNILSHVDTQDNNSMKKYTVSVIATHRIIETYVVFSDKSIEDLRTDIDKDPYQLYAGEDIHMIDDKFDGCIDLCLDKITQEKPQ
jgi:hypothetical protein